MFVKDVDLVFNCVLAILPRSVYVCILNFCICGLISLFFSFFGSFFVVAGYRYHNVDKDGMLSENIFESISLPVLRTRDHGRDQGQTVTPRSRSWDVYLYIKLFCRVNELFVPAHTGCLSV